MKYIGKDSVSKLEVDHGSDGQRIDNFLMRLLKGVPKSHVYRILRSGEVRLNSRRVTPSTKVVVGDILRIPPVRTSQRPETRELPRFNLPILFEDEAVLAIDKPAGVAVHGGSGVSGGVIETLRLTRSDQDFLELVHRLDKETSGVLLLAKSRPALLSLHQQIRDGGTEKFYQAVVHGTDFVDKSIRHPLRKFVNKAGERKVVVDRTGQDAVTVVRKLEVGPKTTLVEAELKTGRTHQIRVHLAHEHFPIIGDEKYGDFYLNRKFAKMDVKRMLLHAVSFTFSHPKTKKRVTIRSDTPREFGATVKMNGVEN
jgi:23S rRNA pseudouridine955/2504/2580 synthase